MLRRGFNLQGRARFGAATPTETGKRIVKSPFRAKLLARIVHEHALATRHYNNVVRNHMDGAKLQATKERLKAIRHARKARALQHLIRSDIQCDEDTGTSLQSVWKRLLAAPGSIGSPS